MTRILLLGLLIVEAFLISVSDAEAKPKRSEMCGYGCTCDQLRQARQENPAGYQACLDKDKSLLGGPKYYLGCAQGGVGCCHMNGIVEVCELLRPVPPPPPTQTPLQGTPGPPPARR